MQKIRFSVFGWLAVSFILVFSNTVSAQNPNDGFSPSLSNINVNAFAVRPDGKIYVGGGFNTMGGLSRKSIALINGDGSGDASFNATGADNGIFVGAVYAVAIQADGKIVIGGAFDKVNGVARTNIARLDQFGNLDMSYAPVVNDVIFSLDILPDQSIVIGGAFTQVNSTPRSRLAKIATGGTLDASFDPSPNATVRAVKFDNRTGKIYFAGDFATVAAQSRPVAARLFSNGSLDLSFNPSVANFCASIAFQADGKILIGSALGIQRFSPNGTLDASLNVSTGSWVSAIALQTDGKIVIGGFITSINGTPRNKVARLNLDGTLDTTFDPNVNGSRLDALAVQPDGKILIGGAFSSIGGISRFGIGRVFQDGKLDDNANAAASDVISVIAPLPRGNQTLIGGNFTTFDGITSQRLARVTSDGKRDANFTNQNFAGGWVQSITLDVAERYLVGGEFTNINGNMLDRYLVRLFSTGALDTTFTPNLNNAVYTSAVLPNGQILIGGAFTNINGTPRNYIARLNSNGTLDTTFTPTFNFWVDKIIVQQDKILVSGLFSNVNGATRVGIARLNSDGTLDTTFNVTFTGLGEIYEVLLQPDGKILIGGGFTSVNGTARSNIARLNANGTLDTGFTASADATPLNMAMQADGKIVVGGRFLNLNGTPRAYIGRINADGSLDTTFVSNASDVVLALAQQSDGKVLVGGYFATINGVSRTRFARLGNATPAVENLAITPTSIEWSRQGSAPAFTKVDFYDAQNLGLIGGGTRDATTGNWRLNNVSTTGYILARGYHQDFSSRRGIVEIVQWSPNVPTAKTVFDFDGDGKTDISIFRPAGGEWWYFRSSDGQSRAFQFGVSTDKLTPADFTGDGKTDIVFWRPSNGRWYVLRSEDSSYYEVPFGTSGDIPAPADYDGDGKADIAIFRPSAATWYILQTSGGTHIEGFGLNTDVPAVADYDGDGKADIAIFRAVGNGGAGASEWWRKRSSDNVTIGSVFGTSTDKPVQGDYTDDGKADLAFFRPSTGEWFVNRSENPTSFYAAPFGISTDVPVPGDYDGDGKYDTSVFRPSNSTWYSQRTTAGTLIQQFGISGDKPVPNAYVP